MKGFESLGNAQFLFVNKIFKKVDGLIILQNEIELLDYIINERKRFVVEKITSKISFLRHKHGLIVLGKSSENRFRVLSEKDFKSFGIAKCEGLYIVNKTGLLFCMRDMSNVTELKLSGKNIKSLDDSLYRLSSLKVFDLSRNQLEKFPRVIGRLIHLDLSENLLQEIHDSIGNLGCLRYLCVESNKLEMIPLCVGNLVKLEELNAKKTKLRKYQ